MELNVECDSKWTTGNLQSLTVTGSEVFPFCIVPLSYRFVPELVTIYHVMWGHISGLQCYDNLGSICAVLTVQKKAVDNFAAEHDSWKFDIHSFSHEIPSFNGMLTFISELKKACHCATLSQCILSIFFLWNISHPIITFVEAANFHFI